MFDGLRFNHWSPELRPDGVVVLSFDRAGSGVNTLAQEVLDDPSPK
jgi:3-hydroxyacyl-CoA dehydrogenase/enoyl-CoA hydratase/3-hydroxybutyryl-CoA epimerase